MAPFTHGTGGTLPVTTNREDRTRAAIGFLRIQQATAARNPNNLRYLTITENTDGALSGSFSCPVTVAPGASGAVTVTASSYLTGVTYTASTGGDSSAANEVQELIDTVMRQKSLELDASKNPTNANYLSWSVTMGSTGVGSNNATINLNFAGLPGDMSQGTNGAIIVEGRTYLT